jgi:hypothetical protein
MTENLHRCARFTDYLDAVTAQTRKYGRKGFIPYEEPESLLLGFSSPEGTWVMSVGVVKAAFTGEWRENEELVNSYYKLGGQTPVRLMTRVLPLNELGRQYKLLLEAAIRKGLRNNENYLM